MKKIISFVLACIMSFAVLTPISASAAFYKDKEGNYYYKNDEGKKVVGFKKINGKYYYFDKKGIMAKDCFAEINGSVYGFGKDGVMRVGWYKENGKYYYFKSNGKLACGWLKISDKQYYFSETDFHMCTGQTFINGVLYNFKSDGVWDGKAGIKYPDFRNGNWGDTYKTVSSKENMVNLKDGLYVGNSVKVGDYSYIVYYSFDSNKKLYKGEYILNDDASNIYDSFSCYQAYNQAVETLTAKYGEPTNKKITHYYDSSLGFWDEVMIDAASAMYEWETDITKITLRFMSDDDATPSVYIVYSPKNYKPTINKKSPNTTNV